MDSIIELQRTKPGTPARVRSATVGACVMTLARWLRSLDLLSEQAGRYIDRAVPVIEQIVSEGNGELIVFALAPSGLRAFASSEDAELNDFVQWADALGAPLLGVNPALIDRMAQEIANMGGSADARGRLH